MQLYREYNNFYITPCLKVYHDRFFEGGLMSLDIELTWLSWTIGFKIINK